MNIRRATNNDSNEIISLITSIYNEYGEIMYTEGADRDLLDIRGNYHAKGGDFTDGPPPVTRVSSPQKGTHYCFIHVIGF